MEMEEREVRRKKTEVRMKKIKRFKD